MAFNHRNVLQVLQSIKEENCSQVAHVRFCSQTGWQKFSPTDAAGLYNCNLSNCTNILIYWSAYYTNFQFLHRGNKKVYPFVKGHYICIMCSQKHCKEWAT
ncbi:unnamed protein product [Ixodes pacificus]